MSSNHLNLYVTKNAKGLNSFETICSTMFGAKKTKLNQKAQLTQLRELSIYLSAVTSIDENVFSAITSFLKDLGDSDTDRKLFRTAMYLLIEAITEYSARNELTNKRGAVLVLNNLLGKELSQKGGSSKQLLIWRNVGAIVWAHNSQFRRLSALEVEDKPSLLSRNTEIETTIVSRVHSTFEGLSFPVKQKKSVLFGDDKEFLPKMLQWTSVLSAVVRSEEALPKKAWENLSFGLTCTSYTPLAQHAFRALLNTAKQTQDPTMQLQLINQLLADRDGSKGREYLNTSDVLCCTYYIRTLTALSENNPDLAKVDPTVKHTECSPVLKALVGLYVGALRFLQSNSVKTVTDMANALLDRQLGPRIICLVDQHLRGQRRPVNTRTVPGKSNNNNAKVGVIAMVTEALQNHLQAQRSIESIDLPPLLRACETLGRFLVHRPYISAKQQQKDGDTIAGLWTTLRRHYRSCLMPKDDCVGTDAQRAGRALAQRQLRAQAGSSCGGSNCVGYTGKSSWSWPSDNPSIATSAVNHNPHVLCALLRAQIWMAPDKRYCPKEHGLLWGAFAESLLSSWQLMTTTLSRDFDLLSLLLPLLHELFARVQASMLVPMHPHGGNSAAPTPISSYTHFLELGEVGTGPAAVPEVGFHYQPVYVDVLVALAEQLVMVTRSGIAVSFLQSVWKWLQAFTTAKQHKQQAALQLKKELRSKQLASAGIGANNTSLLFPSNLTTMAPLATAQVEAPVETAVEAHEAHADQVLLQSVARMTVYAQQQQHLHTASVPQVVGTSAVEAAHVMQNMYTSGLWHLVDNAMLCFALPPTSSAEGGDVTTTESSAAAAHVSSLLLVVKILSEAAVQGEQPNVRNSAILGLTKLSSQMLLLSEKGELGLQKDGETVVLGTVFKDLALVYLTHYGHTLDVTYRHVLQQLLGGASTGLRQRAGQAQAAGGVDLVVELMAHIFAQPGASSSVASALPTVFTILRETMKMLCAALQTTGGALEEGGFRAFAVAHAQLSRNTFVLLVPPALPEEPEEEEEEDFDEYEEPEESTSAPAGDAAPSLVASTAGGQFNGFDDDFFGGGWSSSATVLQPTIAAKPLAVAASASSVNLLDTEDMWIFDTPVVPEKSPKPFSSASLKAGALLDFFGQSSQPLVPASSKHQTPAGGDADPAPVLVPVIAEPPRKPIILFRDIYGEDEPFTASNNTDGAADVAFAPSVADAGSSTAFPTTPDFATTPAFPVTATSGTSATGDLDWPSGGSAHTGDGFDLSASATNAFDGWGGASTASSFPAAAAKDDGFAPTTHPFASTTASTVAPRSSFTSSPAVQAVSDNWSMPSDGFAPSVAAPSAVAPTAASQFADDGFGNLPGFASEPTAGAAPPSNTVRRASFSNSKAALSAEEVAAQAAAKRANRRASMGASATQGKLAADPFFSAAPLVPLTAATSTTAAPATVAAADGWPGASASDGFATLPSTTTAAWGTSGNDGFASHDAFASTSAGFGTLAPAAVVDDGFSATPADFVPTPAAGPAAVAGYYGQQYEGYPPYPPAAGAYPPTAYPPSTYPPAGYPQAAYDSGGYAYPPAPAGQYDYNYGNYPAQGYAAPPSGYGQPPADGHHHASHYGTQQAASGYGTGYADPNAYQGAYGYAQPPQQAGAAPAAHGYYPPAAGAQAGYPGQQQQAYPPYAYPPQGGYPPAPGHS